MFIITQDGAVANQWKHDTSKSTLSSHPILYS
jgi:hypothetical protein